MSQLKFFPVVVTDIRLTKPTIALTGLSSWKELQENKSRLFQSLTTAQLLEKITLDIHKNKLRAKELRLIEAMSDAEKRAYLVGNLSITIEMTQEIERIGGDEDSTNLGNVFSLFMNSRINISDSNTSTKYHFQTSTVTNTEQLGAEIGQDLSAKLAKQGILTYIARIHSFKPIFNEDGYITSAPKRAGKDGDLLTKDGNLIFMHTKFVIQPNLEQQAIEDLYAQLYNKEVANHESFVADKDGNIPAANIPAESRAEDGSGMFNPEFQAWLQEKVANTLGHQTVVAPAAK